MTVLRDCNPVTANISILPNALFFEIWINPLCVELWGDESFKIFWLLTDVNVYDLVIDSPDVTHPLVFSDHDKVSKTSSVKQWHFIQTINTIKFLDNENSSNNKNNNKSIENELIKHFWALKWFQ